MNNEQHPARRMRHGDRPTEPLSFEDADASQQAAPGDLQQLKALDPHEVMKLWGDCGWASNDCNALKFARAIESKVAARIERAAAPAASGDELPPDRSPLKSVPSRTRKANSMNHNNQQPGSADLLDKLRALVYSASAVIERWDSPKWKDEAPTADFIARLRTAVAQASANAPMPQSLPDVAMPEQIETAAKAIYELLPTDRGCNAKTHPWQRGGNSMKQDEARRYARAALETLAEGSAQVALTDAARDVLAERHRQVEQEGWTPAHDDKYRGGELALAAACYANTLAAGGSAPHAWPWPEDWWKPADERRNLVKAGALLLAEIERQDRARIDGDKQGAQGDGSALKPRAKGWQQCPNCNRLHTTISADSALAKAHKEVDWDSFTAEQRAGFASGGA